MESDSGPRLTLPSNATKLKAKGQQGTNRIIATCLSILEELGSEHDGAVHRLRAALPDNEKAFADLIRWFDEDRYDILRTRILRAVNDARREMEETIDSLRIE